MELTKEDKQRIEQEAIKRKFHGVAILIFNEADEYATLYEREVWIKQCEELIRTRNVMSEGYKLEIKRLEAERSELRAKVEKRLDVVNGLMQKMKSTLYWHERKEEKDFLTEVLNSLKTK